jgi:hypothetical protein
MRRNSMVDCCAVLVELDKVSITIPSVTGVAHAGSALLEFSTSTRHILQFAAIESFS